MFLEAENIVQVPASPGAYLLGVEGRFIYVGRSDTDLRGRIRDHLPHIEQNDLINRHKPDRFWYQATKSSEEAYHLDYM